MVLKETVAQLTDTFPGIPIFPALGNHESAPVNRCVNIGCKPSPSCFLKNGGAPSTVQVFHIYRITKDPFVFSVFFICFSVSDIVAK
jgi:hypothetical protein